MDPLSHWRKPFGKRRASWESFCVLAWRTRWTQYFVLAPLAVRKGPLGKLVLSPLQSRAWSRPEIRCGVHVRPDGGNQAAAKIGGPADLLLPTMLGLAGYGPAARGCAELGGMEHDPRPGGRRPGAESGGLGESARYCRTAARGHGNRRRASSSVRRRILRVLTRNFSISAFKRLSVLIPSVFAARPASLTARAIPIFRCY